jgi:hypothetical protein
MDSSDLSQHTEPRVALSTDEELMLFLVLMAPLNGRRQLSPQLNLRPIFLSVRIINPALGWQTPTRVPGSPFSGPT